MLGYVTPDKPELKVREYELYSAYYCGICRAVKKKYGQIPRLVLNYDFVFLALILTSLTPSKEKIEMIRCPVHPFKKRPIVHGEKAIDYAADMMLLLFYHKLIDDKTDEDSIKARFGILAMKKAYKKLMKSHGEKCIIVEDRLRELLNLEKECCTSLDRAAEPFSSMIGEIFVWESLDKDESTKESLKKIGYHLGKWIYLIDAYDDISADSEKGSYNPLICQGNYKKEEGLHNFLNKIKARAEHNMLYNLSELSKAYEELKIYKNKELIENIIFLGLLKKTDEVLKKGNL